MIKKKIQNTKRILKQILRCVERTIAAIHIPIQQDWLNKVYTSGKLLDICCNVSAFEGMWWLSG